MTPCCHFRVQDKDKHILKKLKAKGLDKKGREEAEVRKKFSRIIEPFWLARAGVEAAIEKDNSQAKPLFKCISIQDHWKALSEQAIKC